MFKPNVKQIKRRSLVKSYDTE